jgi:polyhydroxyalkanoate synthesis regulator phasin
MRIANPMYDVFFKFLMEDTDLAKELIGTLINQEIFSLELRPQETTLYIPTRYLSVIRLDFKATIKTKSGEYKKVLIEMQKGKHSFDILRFRKYLGENYAKVDEIKNDSGEIEKVSLPIIAIYFLGFELDNVLAAVLQNKPEYHDVLTGENLQVRNDLVEQLNHDCYFVQIPRLKIDLKNRVSKMLVIFNQNFIVDANKQVLVIPDEFMQDAELLKFITRLSKPLLSERLLRDAEAEEVMEEAFEKLETKIERIEGKLEKQATELVKQATELETKDKELESKDRELAELKRQLENLQNKN